MIHYNITAFLKHIRNFLGKNRIYSSWLYIRIKNKIAPKYRNVFVEGNFEESSNSKWAKVRTRIRFHLIEADLVKTLENILKIISRSNINLKSYSDCDKSESKYNLIGESKWYFSGIDDLNILWERSYEISAYDSFVSLGIIARVNTNGGL